MAATAAILGFQLAWFYLIFIYTSSLTCCYIVSFNLIRLVVYEKMFKTDFQDGGCSGQFGFPITI